MGIDQICTNLSGFINYSFRRNNREGTFLVEFITRHVRYLRMYQVGRYPDPLYGWYIKQIAFSSSQLMIFETISVSTCSPVGIVSSIVWKEIRRI